MFSHTHPRDLKWLCKQRSKVNFRVIVYGKLNTQISTICLMRTLTLAVNFVFTRDSISHSRKLSVNVGFQVLCFNLTFEFWIRTDKLGLSLEVIH